MEKETVKEKFERFQREIKYWQEFMEKEISKIVGYKIVMEEPKEK